MYTTMAEWAFGQDSVYAKHFRKMKVSNGRGQELFSHFPAILDSLISSRNEQKLTSAHRMYLLTEREALISSNFAPFCPYNCFPASKVSDELLTTVIL
ncbi:hypothetical protein BaRGS_00016187 [Batillaria attramentaria]|uniref:Uncharacterized protein n=1 Tax=Batillaria attramentaria TaxID=370345 RepID=A0ABD0KZ64_9CAEN